MLNTILDLILFQLQSGWVFGIVVLYFLFIYFFLGKLFLWGCQFLEHKKYLEKIISIQPPKSQIKLEILYSLQSIIIFGFLSVILIQLIREDYIQLSSNSILQIFLGLLILNVWNEIHFFIIHKIMHLPFFMKNVHKIHHQSYIPTLYSVYRFHWFEALLLGTLPLTIAPFIPLSPISIALYPICSLLINFSGHCNYRFGKGNGPSWKLISSNHNNHHYKGKQNFGFASDILDKLFNSKTKK